MNNMDENELFGISEQLNDTISRQAAIDAVRSYYDEFDTSDKSIEERIEDLPSEQSARMNGEWITNLYAFGDDRYECNQCHNTARHCYDFCPNCGADMRGEQNE